MRNAGVPIEALIEYVKLFQMGDATFGARLDLLKEQYEKHGTGKLPMANALC